MNESEYLSRHGRRLLDRRSFMRHSGFSLGALGLASLLRGEEPDNRAASSEKPPIRPDIDPDRPMMQSLEVSAALQTVR